MNHLARRNETAVAVACVGLAAFFAPCCSRRPDLAGFAPPAATTNDAAPAPPPNPSLARTAPGDATSPPVIENFVAQPSSIRPGESTALSWSVKGATHVRLSPRGTVDGSSIEVAPAATLTYVLAATNRNGTSTATVLVNVTQPSNPRTLFVASQGDDATADGAPSRPFRSVQKAVDAARPGDTVWLRTGTYAGAVRIRQPNITLASAPGERAVLTSPTTKNAPGAVVQVDPDAHGCKLQRLEIVGGAYYGVFLQTTWEWGDPLVRHGPGHVLVEDSYIHDTGRDGIKVTPGTDDVTVRRCTVAHTGSRDPSNAEGIDAVDANRMLVAETYIHDVATSGVYFKGGSIGARIERSLVTDCGGSGILLGFDTSPEFFDVAANPGFYECIDCVARNNVVARTAYSGIGFFATVRARAVHNTIVLAGAKGHSAVHFGVVLHDWEDGVACPANLAPEFVNNIVVQDAKATTPMLLVRFTADHGGVSGLEGDPQMAANRYFKLGGTALFEDKRPQRQFRGRLSEWQRHVNGDEASAEGDPRLDRAFHLVRGSPCIDKARPGAADDDYDGDRRDGSPDIGADEFGSGVGRPIPPDHDRPGTTGP